MIRAESLTRRFGDLVAVDRIDFQVPRGSVTGFLGPNGAGKTTTMRMLCGVLTPSGGKAWVDSIDVTATPERARARIGYLPESAPVYPELRVREYLRFRAGLYQVSSPGDAMERVIQQCGLAEVHRRIIGQLSKGYRQRVALAAAMLHDPPVLVLDEPTAGLDPTQVDTIRTLIQTLAEDRAILLSTHILSEVEAVCDSMIMIAGGQVLAHGTLEEVRGGDRGCCLVETDLDSAAEVLSGVPGVQVIETRASEPGWHELKVTFDSDQDLRSTIASTIVQAGGRIREMHARRRSLEEIFRSLLSSPGDSESSTKVLP